MASEMDTIFSRLIKGQAKYQAMNLGFNLLISRMQKTYQNNQTPAELDNCLLQMNAFCIKYKTIMAKEMELLEKI